MERPRTAEHRSGCLLCGRPLVYRPVPSRTPCAFCGRDEETAVRCEGDHFVCDACHDADADEWIQAYCEATDATDPLEMAGTLMAGPAVHMHGPEHHFLVPAVLLAACRNAPGAPELPEDAISTARARAEHVRGGFCGTHGACGAGVGVGIFAGIATGATPLTTRSWRSANRATARALEVIADHGGPRCCKRDTYLAVRIGAAFAREELGIPVPEGPAPVCAFHPLNRECLRGACPFFPTEGNQRFAARRAGDRGGFR